MDDTTLRSDIDRFLDVARVERGLARNTLSAYRRDLERYAGHLDGRAPTPELVGDFVARMSSRGLATSTMLRAMAAVRSFHRFRVVEGLAESDPTVAVELPNSPDAVPKALTIDQAIRVVESPDLSTLGGIRDRAILEFLYGSGARVSEAVALDLADLDLVDRTAMVTGKGSRQRMVPLGAPATDALAAWLHARVDVAPTSEVAVFTNLRGGRLTRQGMFGVVKGAATSAGVDRAIVSPHVLRHSAATHMIQGGADLRSVQEMLGHANVTTTQRYTRVTASHLLEMYVQAHPRSR